MITTTSRKLDRETQDEHILEVSKIYRYVANIYSQSFYYLIRYLFPQSIPEQKNFRENVYICGIAKGQLLIQKFLKSKQILYFINIRFHFIKIQIETHLHAVFSYCLLLEDYQII